MTTRHDITPMMEVVLMALSRTPKKDSQIWMGTFFTDCTDHRPASIRSTRGILTRLVRIGYASTEQIDGQDFWTITEAGEGHWPTAEELEETARNLRAFLAQIAH